MNIILKPNVCLTMIGPSHSGKSVQAHCIKIYLESIGKTCKIISSDAMRREMLHLGPSDPIPNSEGYAISDIVFKKIFDEMKYYMSSPCNTDVVIIDTTGLDTTFREQVANTAKEYSYANIAMIFHLNISTLGSRVYGSEEECKHKSYTIEKQLKRLKERVLPKFNKHSYMSTYRIDDKKIYQIEYSYEDNSKVLHLNSGKHAIYGDVHQQVSSLKNLYSIAEEKGFSSHILIGDYLDKDDEESMKNTIQFVYDQCLSGNTKVIRANHEEYVYNHLKDPKYEYALNDETAYFTSLEHLIKPENEEYKNMFFKIFEHYTYDFGLVKNNKCFGYISHSPCLELYLGKKSPKALKMMRNTRFFGEVDGVKSSAVSMMKPILDEANSNKAFHIFGHVEVGNKFHVHKNKIAIDTGCVSGGVLTALLFDVDNDKKSYVSVKSDKNPEELQDFSIHIEQWTGRVELDPVQEKKLRRLVKSNPAYISGTMSPSASTVGEELSLESVGTAVELFKSRGTNMVIAQKKHMGSNCQMYLFKDRENCYAVSRSGYKIKHPEIEGIIDKEFEKYKGKYDHLLITENELLPWRFLGRGLIDAKFMPYYQAVNDDMTALRNSGLKDFIEMDDSVYDNLEKFNKQVAIYGQDVPGYVEAFGVIYKDGKELLTANKGETLSEYGIDHAVFDLESEEDVLRLHKFYDDLVEDGITEGIVIKPLIWKKDEIPHIKVRNAEYLRIVYGFDYTSELLRHAKNKNIRNKLNISIKEQNLNLTLMDAYSNGNKVIQKEIYSLLIAEFEKERGLDPRL